MKPYRFYLGGAAPAETHLPSIVKVLEWGCGGGFLAGVWRRVFCKFSGRFSFRFWSRVFVRFSGRFFVGISNRVFVRFSGRFFVGFWNRIFALRYSARQCP